MTGREPQKLPQKLDILDLTLGAVQHVWSLKGPHALLALVTVAPYTLMGVSGLLDPFFTAATTKTIPEGYLTSAVLMFVWAILWNTPAALLWYRMFLVGPDQLLKLPLGALRDRILRMLGAFLLFGVMVAGAGLAGMVVIGIVVAATGIATMNQGVMMAVVLVVALLLGGRLCLTFASIALGHRLPFQASWERTKGHGLAISGAFLLSALIATLAASLAHGVIAAALFGPSPEDGPAIASHWLFLTDFLLAPVTYAGTGLVSAVTAAAFWRLIGPPAEAVDIEV